ncbi:hypothetical protein [Mycobacterium riyadhense]|uniref:Uncharacterized protein n=1 Tax=Mycobacterium riyadhense TaxID=486698 RepID=A0A1X2BQN8_9MYCO|nr:hypothetical protein [Mycobacterium riyadhense]MCV7148649.1 hypothetical protein [Mycobacterium riyadhense]ORW65986.1 hypothetical protein AWC22_02120 [Mycobacterium riyadhense]
MVVEYGVDHLGQLGALHEWLLRRPAVGSWSGVAAVELEAFEHGGVEQLAGFIARRVVGLACFPEQCQYNLQTVAQLGALDVRLGDQATSVGDLGGHLGLAQLQVLDRQRVGHVGVDELALLPF